MSKKLKVALIFGGISKERQVSLNTGKTAAKYLDKKKYDILPIEIAPDGQWLVSSQTIAEIKSANQKLKKQINSKSIVKVEPSQIGKIDCALLALHGPGGEDGTIQGMLELMRIPYTCSGVMASSIAMDKMRTKMLVSSIGVPVPESVAILDKKAYTKNPKIFLKNIKLPVVIKPNRLGSSIGVTVAKNSQEILKGIHKAFEEDQQILIEKFIPGREITVPVLGNDDPKALPVIEIIPWQKSKFYDFGAKYSEGGSQHIIPAKISKKQEIEVKNYAVMVHKLLGCRGVTRSDFILTENGQFNFLEINTIPGMTPTSLVPQSAEVAKISFPKLLDKLISLAKNDYV